MLMSDVYYISEDKNDFNLSEVSLPAHLRTKSVVRLDENDSRTYGFFRRRT